MQYTDSPQRIDIEVDGEEEGGGKEEEGQGCADSTVGLSKNMLGLQEWLNDIRLHYISGVGVSGWFDVGVTEERVAFRACKGWASSLFTYRSARKAAGPA